MFISTETWKFPQRQGSGRILHKIHRYILPTVLSLCVSVCNLSAGARVFVSCAQV